MALKPFFRLALFLASLIDKNLFYKLNLNTGYEKCNYGGER